MPDDRDTDGKNGARDGSDAGPAALTGLARGFRKRTLATARLATRAGFGALRKTLRPNAKRAQTATDEELSAAAESLLRQFDGMKGLIMKFGQMASYLDGAMPPAAQRVLARLQAESTPMAPDVIEAVIRDELGAPPSERFERFEPTPFAAASIGQVHRAVYEGRTVAVKVQYPDMQAVLRSDLRTLKALGRVAMIGASVSGGELVDELRARVEEECDYQREAANQEMFARMLADRADASVPRVVPEVSARRVLTTEFSDGRSFAAFRDGAGQAAKNRAAVTIFEVCFGAIFGHCVFNADPHPGNYLFPDGDDDGRVVFLDYGCVKRFDVDFIERWKHFLRVVLAGDRRRFPEAFTALGLVGRQKRFDWDYQWDVFQYLYKPFLSATPFTYTSEHVARSYDVMMWNNPNRFKVALPPDWLFLNRLQWGLQSVLSDLGATAMWGDLIRAILDRPTSAVSA